MALADDIKTLISQLNEATNGVAARIDRLIGQISNSMSNAEVDEIKAALGAERDRLLTMGQDPNNPIPPP